MSQAWTDNIPVVTNDAQADLEDMKDNFACLKSSFSGTTAPANAVEGQIYRNTTYSNWRGYTGAAWVGMMVGDASQKMWVYRDSAMTGWVVDSSVTDKVLSIKGGSTYTTGAATAGSWTISGLAHTHGAGTLSGGTHYHKWYNFIALTTEAQDGQGNIFGEGSPGMSTSYGLLTNVAVTAEDEYPKNPTQDHYTDSKTTTISGSTASGGGSDGTWRPAAATGTLQYLDLT